MKRTLKKKTILGSIGIAAIILTMSFTSAVSFQAGNSSQNNSNSPLFHLRLEKITNQGENPTLLPLYIGKYSPVHIPLPAREIITEEILNQLSSKEVKEKVRLLSNDLLQRWDVVLTLVRTNLAEVNRIIRQDYTEFQTLLTKFSALSEQQAQDQFLERIRALDLTGLKNTDTMSCTITPVWNITSGPICNITSGQICQITTQPICKITTQPICSITKGFFCWTVYGPICPTTGIKCHPPTSRPTLCSIFTAAGKILKALIIIVLLASVIFVPLAIVSLVLITVFNKDRCNQIHERITTWFNCTIPQ
jgi:hypothetical protein